MKKHFSWCNTSKLFKTNVYLFILLLIASFYFFRNFLVTTDFSQFVLFDSDCYMRLIRVKEFYLTGEWFNNTIPASNYPYGEVLHWSRPVDLLLLIGTYIGMIFTDFDTALYWSGVFLSPTLYVLAIIAVYWSAAAYYKDSLGNIFNCVLIFIAQLFTLYAFAFGRPDHHSLLLLLFIIQVGCTLRMLDDQNKYISWCALLAALAMWVSVEAIVSIVSIMTTLLILGINSNSDKYFRQAYRYTIYLVIYLFAFYIIGESLSEDPLVVYDKLSLVHVLLFMLAIPVIYALQKATLASSKQIKIGYFIIILLLISTTCKLFPGLLNPYIDIDPRLYTLWLNHVAEVAPIRLSDKSELGVNIIFLSPFILSLPYCLKLRSKLEYKLFFISSIFIYTALTFYQMRWSTYLSIIALIPISNFIMVMRGRIANLPFTILTKTLLNSFLLILVIAGPLILFTKIDRPASTQATFKNYKLKVLNSYLTKEFAQPQLILGSCDLGAPILYNSLHKVIATSYHRNYAGILYFSDILSSNNYDEIKHSLQTRGVNIIIITPKRNERIMLDTNLPQDALYNQLCAHSVPAWLTRVVLPEEIEGDFIIYKVVNNG